ncbi:hypothetical protein DEF24_26310 [Marinitenerispora sediminis]|uniref:Nitroreductase domain-containing protein n=2 Tax=Marinitenerispora sediminis TaxID=1931232 RepID=A0A368SY05_9ACTN|nr:hypothetical protein DEF24_26310 [Marinitenerispora sediminis]
MLALNPARTVWRYGPRSLPVLLLDLGHAVGALLAAAAARGVTARAEIGPPGRTLAAEAGLPFSDGAVRWPRTAPEYPMAVVRLDLPPPPSGSAPLDSPDGLASAAPDAPGGAVPGSPRSLDGTVPGPPAPPGGTASELLGGPAAPAPCPEWSTTRSGRLPTAPVAGADLDMVAAALAALSSAPAAATIELPPVPPPSAGTLLTRHSAPWPHIGGGGAAVPAAVTEAAAALHGTERVLAVHPREVPDLAAALAERCCGQPQVSAADTLLLLLGSPDPAPQAALTEHVSAGLAAHAAWLTATATGHPVRPVGCWLDTVLHTPQGRRRVLHALAVGSARQR